MKSFSGVIKRFRNGLFFFSSGCLDYNFQDQINYLVLKIVVQISTAKRLGSGMLLISCHRFVTVVCLVASRVATLLLFPL